MGGVDALEGGANLPLQRSLGAGVEARGAGREEDDRVAAVAGQELAALDAQRGLHGAQPLEEPPEGAEGIRRRDLLEQRPRRRSEIGAQGARLLAQPGFGDERRDLALGVVREEQEAPRKVDLVDLPRAARRRGRCAARRAPGGRAGRPRGRDPRRPRSPRPARPPRGSWSARARCRAAGARASPTRRPASRAGSSRCRCRSAGAAARRRAWPPRPRAGRGRGRAASLRGLGSAEQRLELRRRVGVVGLDALELRRGAVAVAL